MNSDLEYVCDVYVRSDKINTIIKYNTSNIAKTEYFIIFFLLEISKAFLSYSFILKRKVHWLIFFNKSYKIASRWSISSIFLFVLFFVFMLFFEKVLFLVLLLEVLIVDKLALLLYD